MNKKELIKAIEQSPELEVVDLIDHPGIEQLARWSDNPEKEDDDIDVVWC